MALWRIVLLGDAAHAATPNLGQGAAQALEDSSALSQHLTSRNDTERALVAFEENRIGRAHVIIQRAGQLGKLGQTRSFERHEALVSEPCILDDTDRLRH